MKVLFLGGTGVISTDITKLLAAEGHEVWLLNRGRRALDFGANVHTLVADIADEPAVRAVLGTQTFDCVADFIAYTPADIARDYRLFAGRTAQYVFISSASVYQKPLPHPVITEGTAAANPYSAYARGKIACEQALMALYRDEAFPVTIVRPSHTYSERSLPVAVHGAVGGAWPVLQRMLQGKPVIVHGDGASLWTVTHSTDFAKGFVGLLGNVHALGETVQITGDESLTWNQIYQTLANALHVAYVPCYAPSALLAQCRAYDLRASLLGDKASSVMFDNAKLRRLVPGFAATTRFDQGAARSVAYFLQHPEMQTPDPAFDAWCDRVAAAMDAAKAVLCPQE